MWFVKWKEKRPNLLFLFQISTFTILCSRLSLLIGKLLAYKEDFSVYSNRCFPAVSRCQTIFEPCVRCFKEICKVGKVGREGLFMPTWSQL
jgi:hypothetical protein